MITEEIILISTFKSCTVSTLSENIALSLLC